MDQAMRITSNGRATCSTLVNKSAASRVTCRPRVLAMWSVLEHTHVTAHNSRRSPPPLATSRDTRTAATPSKRGKGSLTALTTEQDSDQTDQIPEALTEATAGAPVMQQSSAQSDERDSASTEEGEEYADDSDDDAEMGSDEEEEEEEEDDESLEFVGFSEEELMRQDELYAQSILTDDDLSKDSAEHRTGYVTLIGKPNAGKSTLLNSLLGQKLSAVTRKAQTTRHRILGILSGDDFQMILLDTPGIIKNLRTKLDEKMMHNVRTAVQDADALLVILDATEDPAEALAMVNVGPDWKGPPLALVLNKVDLLRGDELQRLTDWLLKNSGASAVIPTSATQGRGVLDVRDWAASQLPLGPTLYPKEVVAEQPERFFVAEILREKILLQYHQEIPYATAVSVTDFKERANGKDYIQIIINVEEESQKPIILGKKGSAIKQLATAARIDIEEFLGRQVYLDITVKVMEKWRKNEKMLEQHGY